MIVSANWGFSLEYPDGSVKGFLHECLFFLVGLFTFE